MDGLEQSYANFRAAKRRLDDAIQEFTDAAKRFEREIENSKIKPMGLGSKDVEGKRLPKGHIEELLALVFGLDPGPMNYNTIRSRLEDIQGSKISDATIRQTLRRMVKGKKLESYSGRYSRGLRLIEK